MLRSFIMNFVRKKRKIFAGIFWVISSLSYLGCNSYNELASSGYRIKPSSPSMLFSLPHKAYPSTHYSRVSGEGFNRPEWPVSQVPAGYISGTEQAIYYENIQDHQYNSSDNRARDRFHRRSGSSRQVIRHR